MGRLVAKLFFRTRRNNFGFNVGSSFRIFFGNNGEFQIQVSHSEERWIACPNTIDFYLFELVLTDSTNAVKFAPCACFNDTRSRMAVPSIIIPRVIATQIRAWPNVTGLLIRLLSLAPIAFGG